MKIISLANIIPELEVCILTGFVTINIFCLRIFVHKQAEVKFSNLQLPFSFRLEVLNHIYTVKCER